MSNEFKRKVTPRSVAPMALVLFGALGLLAAFSHSALATRPIKVDPSKAHPELWPKAQSPIGLDPVIEDKITAIMAKMTIEEKVGQIIQPEMKSITPADVRAYHIGSIENGGGSVPNGNKHASVSDWVNMIDAYYQASVDPSAHSVPIPMMWASDAVHGHNNVYGATLFPHNIGLGAARDPDLMRRIGEVTAAEVRSLGMDWSFAPTIAVVRDDRWGRTYESYSEDPKIVVTYATAIVKGLQGEGDTFLNDDHVFATAKHFLGDGSTDGGRDQGETAIPESELSRLHGVGYASAVDAGVQSVMASYNSWYGLKMHANKALMTDILKGRMGFDGIIMGDWNAHGQIPGCTNGNCATAFNAGLDIFNVPQDWKELHGNLVAQVKSGVIPMSRLDDAVRRVLRVKFRAGIMDQPSPAKRVNTFKPLGTPEHRAVAREAVRKSLVLIKNNGAVLPIKPSKTILITGEGADNIGMQTGGWTLSWQGNDNSNADFPGATSIFAGLKAQAEAAGGKVILSPDGLFYQKPDVAIVVMGEKPYAEFQGDQSDVALHNQNAESLELIKSLKAKGIPVVVILLSGRPLYLNDHINASDAFVAAWLPGSEGQGIADVLLAKADGRPQYDFQGTLSFSWPKRPDQTPLNVGDKGYDPQFAYGYGLTYAKPKTVPRLPTIKGGTRYGERGVFFTKGQSYNGFDLFIGDNNMKRMAYVGTKTTLYGTAALSLEPQGQAVKAQWTGRNEAWFDVASEQDVDLSREANGAMMLSLKLRVTTTPQKPVMLTVAGKGFDVTASLAPIGQDTEIRVPLTCFAPADQLKAIKSVARLSSDGAFGFELFDVRLIEAKADVKCPA